ncbi:MauE/DoxX family redox-associated membrane protein [Marinobacter sp.]|uniref:MauE/DoxX family redox-associated membrane protein n=1 Tax=Marinobacter sp. TaxID=50741 RepID=UPI0035627605
MVLAYLEMSVLTATVVLALLFAHAVWHKISDYGRFLGYVIDYRLVPESMAEFVARALIAAEAILVLLLLYPATSWLGAVGVGALLLLYGCAMAVNLFRGRSQIECGCGGASHPVSWLLVIRNLMLAGMAALVAMNAVEVLAASALAVALGAGIGLWLVYNLLGKLAENQRLLTTAGKS